MAPVKVATWNVNGIRARSSQLVHWVDREEPTLGTLSHSSPFASGTRTRLVEVG